MIRSVAIGTWVRRLLYVVDVYEPAGDAGRVVADIPGSVAERMCRRRIVRTSDFRLDSVSF